MHGQTVLIDSWSVGLLSDRSFRGRLFSLLDVICRSIWQTRRLSLSRSAQINTRQMCHSIRQKIDSTRYHSRSTNTDTFFFFSNHRKKTRRCSETDRTNVCRGTHIDLSCQCYCSMVSLFTSAASRDVRAHEKEKRGEVCVLNEIPSLSLRLSDDDDVSWYERKPTGTRGERAK